MNAHTGLLPACLLLLSACTNGQQVRPSISSLTDDLPPAHELSETPFIPQTAHQCGPAALATVLQAHRTGVDAETLVPYLYLPERKGSLQIEMAVAARRFGALPYPLEPVLQDILIEIAAGNPVLVLQNPGFSWWPQWHYAVVVGYDLNDSTLVLRSGTTKRWQTNFDTFLRTWNRADNWALVVVPAGRVPASAGMTTYLKAAYAFEQTGMDSAALDAYRAATGKWPDQALSWLSLGNLAYQTGLMEEAVNALSMAAALNPADAATWNNLAYALHGFGCPTQSLASLQCARRLSPADQNIDDSEQEIGGLPLQPPAPRCPDITCE